MKLYTYDITEGDKGIIFANSYEEAVELFKADYPEIEVVEAYDDFHTCVIEEFDLELQPTYPMVDCADFENKGDKE